MTSIQQRLEKLVSKLCRDVTTHLILHYRWRLRPETLDHFRALFEDALKAYAAAVELHGHDRADDTDDLVESFEDTRPGFKSRPPPKK